MAAQPTRRRDEVFGFIIGREYFLYSKQQLELDDGLDENELEGLGASIVSELGQAGVVDFFVRVFAAFQLSSEAEAAAAGGARYVLDRALLSRSDQRRLFVRDGRGPLTVALSGRRQRVRELDELPGRLAVQLFQRRTMAVPNFRQSWERVSHGYLVDLDCGELLVARHHHRLRSFDLSPSLPADWAAQLRKSPTDVASAVLPISRGIRDDMAAQLAQRGYALQRWHGQRSANNLIGEAVDRRTEALRVVKCFVNFAAHHDAEAWAPYDAANSLVKEGWREVTVAQRVQREAGPDDRIVGVCDVFCGRDVDDDASTLWAVVMEKAVSDLESQLDAERSTNSDSGGDEMEQAEHVFQQIERAIKWTYDVLTALQWFHSRGFVFMDLKLSNVLLTSAGDAVLCDFESVAQRSSPGAGDGSKWQRGWEPTRYTHLADGFHLADGHTTVYQDYFCLARLLRSLLQRVVPPPLTPRSSLHMLLAWASCRDFAAAAQQFCARMSQPQEVDALSLSQVSDELAAVFVAKLREYHRLFQTLTGSKQLTDDHAVDLLRALAAAG